MREEHIHIESLGSVDINKKQVIFIEPSDKQSLSNDDYSSLKLKYKSHDFDLISLSHILNNIPETLLSFYTPEYKTTNVDLNETISFIESICDIRISKPICLRFNNNDASDIKYVMMEEENDAIDFLEKYLSFIDTEKKHHVAERSASFHRDIIKHCYIEDEKIGSLFREYELNETVASETSCGSLSTSAPDEIATADTLIRELQNMREEDLRKLGLSVASLRFLLRLKAMPAPSKMRITRHAKIILEDFNNREIKLDDKTKALYFLFLRHPEGISIKCLPDHIEELLDIYQSFSGRDDKMAMRKTIENLADPFQNNANISLSRIKKAFCEAFDMQIAKYYFVDGERGGCRKVALDRKLVIWETIR